MEKEQSVEASVTSKILIKRGKASEDDWKQIMWAYNAGFHGGQNWPVKGIDWEMVLK